MCPSWSCRAPARTQNRRLAARKPIRRPCRKKKQKTKTTSAPPNQSQTAIEKELRFEGKLTENSREVLGKPSEVHTVRMSPDKTYIIDLESTDFDAYLRILDLAGRQLAKDDDSGGNHNARIRFTPPKEDNYQVVATRFGFGQGNYLLKIRVDAEKQVSNQPPLQIEKEQRIEGKLTKNSPKVLGKPAQIHTVRLSSDRTYIIDLESADFDAYLRILDETGKQLAEDDDSGEGLNARIRFTPPKDGNYQIVATRFASGQGNYLLKIRVLRGGEDKQP